MASVTKDKIRKWRDGADGFLKWLSDIGPRVPSCRGGFTPFVPEQFQIDAIRGALERNEDGTWKYGTIAFSFPRRHSKTTLMALLCLWRFFNWPNQNIVCMANSERQIAATGFTLCKQIIKNTQSLVAQLEKTQIQMTRINYLALQNSIRTVPSNISALYGEKITVAWTSELHASNSDEPMQVLASSLGDTINSWLLIDSTVDGIGGPLHRLEQLAESGDDPTIYVNRVEYADLAEALEKSPSWINKQWLKSRKAQLLPATFATQHLNQRAAASNNLFAPQDIEACKMQIPSPVDKNAFEDFVAGRTWQAGGGLDRAYFASMHGDKTIWTCVAKVAAPDGGEAHFIVLNQKNILGSLGSGIKRAIMEDHEQWGLHNCCVEAYNSQDIAVWMQENNIPTEIIHATNTAQTPAFMEFHRLVKEHRLHFSDQLDDLVREMSVFTYELVKGAPRFGDSKHHDDRVYSLAWAIYSLRQSELATYSLDNVVCDSKSFHNRFCYLRSGDAIITCSRDCPTHAKVRAMYLQHRKCNIESDITIQEFFRNFVKVSGVRMYASY